MLSVEDWVEIRRLPDHSRGQAMMEKLIAYLSGGVPRALTELVALGRNLNQRPADVLASTGPVPATAPPRPSTTASNTSEATP